MQEYEYKYAPGLEPIQEHRPVREADLLDNLSGQELELVNESDNAAVASECSEQADQREEMRDQRATLRLGRGLALGLGLSFLASLTALWFSSTLLSAPDQILPVALLQMLAANRVVVICVPVFFLVVCYVALRSLTAEIMAVPVHRLDERQKILHDQAHRSAFKIIKFAGVLIPVAFVLPHLPWFNPPTNPLTLQGSVNVISVYDTDGKSAFPLNPNGPRSYLHGPRQFVFSIMRSGPAAPLVQPASTLEVALAAGLLLVSLLLMFSALPMAVLAWKGKA